MMPKNPPQPRTGNLYAAVDHHIKAQMADPTNAEKPGSQEIVDAYLGKVRQFLGDVLYREGLTDSQRAWHIQTMRWLKARGDLSAADLAKVTS